MGIRFISRVCFLLCHCKQCCNKYPFVLRLFVFFFCTIDSQEWQCWVKDCLWKITWLHYGMVSQWRSRTARIIYACFCIEHLSKNIWDMGVLTGRNWEIVGRGRRLLYTFFVPFECFITCMYWLIKKKKKRFLFFFFSPCSKKAAVIHMSSSNLGGCWVELINALYFSPSRSFLFFGPGMSWNVSNFTFL